MNGLRRPALSWVLRHPRVLIVTAAHVAIDLALVAVVVALFYVAPVGAGLVVLPFAYVGAFTATLADATIIAAVADAAGDGRISLTRAWGVAWAHRRPLAAWAFDLLAVGVAIRLGAFLFGWLGRLLGLAAAIAWTLVSLLVVPAIVVGDAEMPGAFDVSRQALRRTFGDRIRGVAQLGWVGLVVSAAGAAVVIGAALADSSAVIVVALAVAVALALAYAFVVDAAMAVLGYSIYAHATQRPLPPGFTAAGVRGAFVATR